MDRREGNHLGTELSRRLALRRHKRYEASYSPPLLLPPPYEGYRTQGLPVGRNPFHDTFLKVILYNVVVFCCHLGSLKFTQKSSKSAQTAILVVSKGWMISSPGQPGLVPAVGAPPQLFLELRVYKCLAASWANQEHPSCTNLRNPLVKSASPTPWRPQPLLQETV